jgi:carnitine-CoA ligase
MYQGIETFGEIVRQRAEEYGNRTFIKFKDDALTYSAFHSGGNRLANVLAGLGLEKGDACAVMLPNRREFLTSWLGLARIGVIEVPVNTGLRGDLLAHVLDQAECKAVIVLDEWAERIADIAPALNHLRHVIVVGNAEEVPFIPGAAVHRYGELLEQGQDHDPGVEVKPNDPSLILFTSGTTGPSKGAILSHRANFALAKNCCGLMGYTPDDRLYTVFPLYHVNARYATVLAALVAGSDVVMHNRFSASRFWDICREEGITTFNYMGSMLTILMKQPPGPGDLDHNVRMIQGAPCPPELLDDFRSRFGIAVTEAYGSTEVGICIVNRAESFRKGSCGRPISMFDVEIHDEEGLPCPPGIPGEIVVRPKEPSILFSGYYGMADATVKAWKNLWFHTGDRGMTDEDGYFYFLDRQKDVVRRRGENISSYEVERVLNGHSSVEDTAIIGVPSELSEEEVMAVVRLKKDQNAEPAQLLDHCVERLPHFAVPRYIRFVTEFPRTPSQRIEKYKLRKEGVTSDTWDREEAGYVVAR